MTSIVPLCTLVQTNLGPTPRNQPPTPSVLYIILRPVMIEDVSSGGTVLGTVLGPECICLVCPLAAFATFSSFDD